MVFLSEVLPTSSTHHRNPTYVYDVFLSFRGVDTRNGFTDHLYNALIDAGITTFLDDEEIETGESLRPELENAIRSSRASVIVLSKNYASSTWCLQELVLILEQQRSFSQIVIPIFYDVEPADVRKQQNSFGEAMAQHKERMEAETDAQKKSQLANNMDSWKMALAQVANLKGKDAKGRKETKLIEEVVVDIHRRLGALLSNTLPDLIGMDGYIRSISSWLTDGPCPTAKILTIVGMSGIGKTSLARYIFGLHSRKFHKSSFIEGINARCKEKFNGLLDLQKQLYRDISKQVSLQVNDVSVYTSMIENILARKTVFIVLDDIDSLDQMDALLGYKGLHPGSKIIVTTKDASLTETSAYSQVQSKQTRVLLNGLREPESLELLCIHAFKTRNPKGGYEDAIDEIVEYCEGHPLALKVLGGSLYQKDVIEWKDCIEALKKEPHSHINNALKMSFDSLPSKNDKELFKHIACFFVGTDRGLVETILNACDINTRSGIAHLTDRCLLSIERNMLMMHKLVQEMGRDIVRQESPDKPWERSRVWCHEESFKVLEKEKGENLLGLTLDVRMLEKEKWCGSLQLKTDALNKMDNLKLLQLSYVKISGPYMNISKELRWLCMHGFCFKSIPSDLPMEKLVALDMSHSHIESFDMSDSFSRRLVSGVKWWLIGSSSNNKPVLGSLKILNLSFCEKLLRIGGFLELPALERLELKNCISLIEVCESVEQCVELIHIDLSYCCKLKKLPTSIGKLNKVETLLLDGCSFLESQIKKWDIKTLNINTYTQNSSSAIPNDLKFFVFSLPSSLVRLSLANNNLSNESFPVDFSYLSMLVELCLDGNPIVSMPNCVRTIPRLQTLSMNDCDNVISIEHPPPTLRTLLKFPACKVRKVKFVSEMSPLFFSLEQNIASPFSCEIDGVVKIQPMVGVEEKLLRLLGWTDLDFTKMRLRANLYGEESIEYQTQLYYEYGIFSTIYEGKLMPNWITCRSEGPSISFTIPSSPKNLRGLNFCWVEDGLFNLPTIKIRNSTKDQTWVYSHYIRSVRLDRRCLVLLSHWMFGLNEMKGGDCITITVEPTLLYPHQRLSSHTQECGISVVYDEDKEVEEKEDILGYYKSWNHIIGGDLSSFQNKRVYNLHHNQFRCRVKKRMDPFVALGTAHKGRDRGFKAFSQKKTGRPSHVVIKEVE